MSDYKALELKRFGQIKLSMDEHGSYVTPKQKIPLFRNAKLFGNVKAEFELNGFDEDKDKDPQAFSVAIDNFLAMPKSAMAQLEEPIFNYYQEIAETLPPELIKYELGGKIKKAEHVWHKIDFKGASVVVQRQFGAEEMRLRQQAGEIPNDAPNHMVVVFRCDCSWDLEQGLQMVFRNGNELLNVGEWGGALL